MIGRSPLMSGLPRRIMRRRELVGRAQRRRWAPRRSIYPLRPAPPIMIGGDAALGTALRAEGGSAPFDPPLWGNTA
jgi:hypothetical protein